MTDPFDLDGVTAIGGHETGHVASVAWLSRELLILVGDLEAGDRGALEGRLVGAAEPVRLDVRTLSHATERGRLGSEWRDVLTVHVPPSLGNGGPIVMEIVDRQGHRVLGPIEVDREVGDLRATLRRTMAPLDAESRASVLAFLTAAPAAHNVTAASIHVSRSLFQVREALRERLPAGTIDRERPRGISVDALLAVDDCVFYAQGWARDAEAPIVRLTAVSPEGERIALLDRLFRYPRRDVEQFYSGFSHRDAPGQDGFIVCFETVHPSRLPGGWIFELENADGDGIELTAPSVLQDLVEVRTRILEGLPLEVLPSEALMAGHVHPAIDRLQDRAKSLVRIAAVSDYGTTVPAPEVSIIIPLYKRIDFLEHQLAQFVHDPEMRKAELVYVLDSPELSRALSQTAPQLHRLYEVPFRVVVLERNSGFAAANNCGASVAGAPLLLLMNSDVLPDRPGWLGRMAEFYRSKPRMGALGPKLLYEDDSLQHAGMYFSLPQDTALAGLWANMHYFKGLHRNLPQANVTRPVPAVTGGCLMISKDLYEKVGGFRNVYVQGDHEDSDLCLRLAQEGLESWYLPEVELYHLEGQSYPGDLRGRTALYNRWIHTRLWGSCIADLTHESAGVLERN